MATRRRIESSGTSLTDAASWGGAAPGAGDLAYIAFACDLSTDLNLAANLNRLVVENGVVVSIGSAAGAPGIFDVSSGADPVFQYFGSGSAVRLQGAYSRIEWCPYGSSKLFLGTGSIKDLVVTAGYVEVSETCDWTAGGKVVVSGGHLVIQAKAGDSVPEIVCDGGSVEIYRDFDAVQVGGGGVVSYDGAGITAGDVRIDASDTGGFVWLDGNLGTVDGHAGVFDYSRLRTPGTATLKEYGGLIERVAVGVTQPTIVRTSYGRGSRKVRG